MNHQLKTEAEYSGLVFVSPIKYRQTSFYCASLYWSAGTAFFFLNKLKICFSPAWSKSASAFCPMTFAHFVSLCHILAVLIIFQTFSLLYLLQWSVINDVPIIIVLGHHKHCPYKMTNLIHPCCMRSNCSPDQLSLFVSMDPLPHSLRHSTMKWGYLMIQQYLVSVQVKGRVADFSF